MKLASELSKKSGKPFIFLMNLYSLHFEDVNILLQVLEKLVNKGNTVLVIEHNLDVIKMADHIIELVQMVETMVEKLLIKVILKK